MISVDVEKTAGAPRAQHGTSPARVQGVVVRVGGIVLGLTVAVAVLAIAFALPAARSKPHDVPIGAVGAQAVQVAAMLQQNAPGAFRVTPYVSEAALRAAIRDRGEYGGVAVGPSGYTLFTATGASPALAQLLSQIGSGLAMKMGVPLRAQDLAPPTAGDPRGAGLIASALPITVAGLLPAIALIVVLPRRPWVRLVALLVFSALAAATLAIVLRDVLGSIDENVGGVAGGLLLGLLGAGLVVLGLGSLLGRVGLIVGSALALLLGNPLSGLASAPEMLPSGWGALGQYLPQGATATLLRSTAFFDGAGAGTAITVLICWALGGVILIGLATLRRTAHHRHTARHFGEAGVWLGAGAITLGIGAVLAGGSGVAHADTRHAGGNGNASGGGTGPAKTGGTSPVASAVNRPPTSSGVAKSARPATPQTPKTPRRSVRVVAAGTPAPAADGIVVHTTAVGVSPKATSAQPQESPQQTAAEPTVAAAHASAQSKPADVPMHFTAANALLGWVYRELRYTLFNRPPTITAVHRSQDPLTGVVTGDLAGHGQDVTYTIGQPDNAVVRINPDGTFTVSPDQEVAHLGGTVSFTVTADNGAAYRLSGPLGRFQAAIHAVAMRLGMSGPDTSTTVVTVDVVATNQSPVITGYTDGAPVGNGVVAGQIQATDPNNDTLTFTGPTTSALGATVTVNSDGSFTYTPTADIRHAAAATNAPDTATTDSFEVTASDGWGGTVTKTVDVPVSPANANPTGGTVTGLQADDVLGFVTGSITGVADPDLDPLTYSTNPTSAGGGIVDFFNDGSFTYYPTADQRHLAAALGAPFSTTHDSFTVLVADGHGGSTAITVIVPIPPESDEPPTGVAAG